MAIVLKDSKDNMDIIFIQFYFTSLHILIAIFVHNINLISRVCGTGLDTEEILETKI